MQKFDDAELKKKLSPEQYAVLREKATEPPFTGKLLDNKEKGMYVCGVCGQPLFSSDTKFESGSGWPSFYDAVKKDAIKLVDDNSLGMHRVEVTCSNAAAILGIYSMMRPTSQLANVSASTQLL